MKPARTAIVFIGRMEVGLTTRFFPTDNAAKHIAMNAAAMGHEVYAFKAMYSRETGEYKDIGQIFWAKGDY